VEVAAAWLLALLWLLPLAYALWSAFHPPAYVTRFDPLAPLTLRNFEAAWNRAPFARYYLNSVVLVTSVLAAQFVLCTLAGYAFSRFAFAGREVAFALVLLQLMIVPEVLIVENYRTMGRLGLTDTILGIGLPYMASAFGIFLLRQTFKTIPRELDEAAQVEGCGALRILWTVYVPLARPTYLATRSSPSATTGTISSGRSSSRTRSRRGRSRSGWRSSGRRSPASTGRSSPPGR
jgi:sn-glycerol 3-phosphate transport system permease protein